tara:strand:- start:723 stop:1034 length:312 start_codon:yes stop_codon:yes gene_type:complete
VKRKIIQMLIISILCGFSMATKAAEVKNINILCLDREQFLNTIGKSQKLFLIGIMSNPENLVEIYTSNNLGWSVVVRSHNGVCVLASGTQLIPVDWFRETKLP